MFLLKKKTQQDNKKKKKKKKKKPNEIKIKIDFKKFIRFFSNFIQIFSTLVFFCLRT